MESFSGEIECADSVRDLSEICRKCYEDNFSGGPFPHMLTVGNQSLPHLTCLKEVNV